MQGLITSLSLAAMERFYVPINVIKPQDWGIGGRGGGGRERRANTWKFDSQPLGT